MWKLVDLSRLEESCGDLWRLEKSGGDSWRTLGDLRTGVETCDVLWRLVETLERNF